MEESLTAMLRRNQDAIMTKWHQWMMSSCSKEAALFMRREQNRFSNPISYAFRDAMEAIYSAIIDGNEPDCDKLDYAIKIKATQGNDPLEGITFIAILKDLLRKELGGSLADAEFDILESRIDQISRTAEAIFITNRAKIAELAGRGGEALGVRQLAAALSSRSRS